MSTRTQPPFVVVGKELSGKDPYKVKAKTDASDGKPIESKPKNVRIRDDSIFG